MENVKVLNGVRQLLDTHTGWMNEDDFFWYCVDLENIQKHIKLFIEDAERMFAVYTQADDTYRRSHAPDVRQWLEEARHLDGIIDRVLANADVK